MIKYGESAIENSSSPMHQGSSGSGGWNWRHAFCGSRSVVISKAPDKYSNDSDQPTGVLQREHQRPGRDYCRGLGWFVRFGKAVAVTPNPVSITRWNG